MKSWRQSLDHIFGNGAHDGSGDGQEQRARTARERRKARHCFCRSAACPFARTARANWTERRAKAHAASYGQCLGWSKHISWTTPITDRLPVETGAVSKAVSPASSRNESLSDRVARSGQKATGNIAPQRNPIERIVVGKAV